MHWFLLEDVGLSLTGGAMFLVSTWTLWWMVREWHPRQDPYRPDLEVPEQSYSIIVPARHEEAVLDETLFRLRHLDHPNVEVLVVVSDDDPQTRVVAERSVNLWPDRFRLVLDQSWPKSKPRALNTALPACRGTMIGIFDAEDEVSPDLLRSIDAALHRDRADVVQASVQLVDLHSRWYSLRNCLEYFFWYRSRMHVHADHGVVPLGGNTVFMRRHLVEAAGGWDDECLAEDCDIGIRLSALGCRTAVVFDPAVSTREETPGSLAGLLKQRTRWNQGFLQVLRKGDLRSYPTRGRRLLARYLLLFPVLQALSALLLPLAAAMVLFAKLPVGVTLACFLPIASTVVTTAVEMVALHEMCRDYFLRLRLRDYLLLILTTFPYQWLLSLAALRAVVREIRGNHAWEKTAHSGAHRIMERLTELEPA